MIPADVFRIRPTGTIGDLERNGAVNEDFDEDRITHPAADDADPTVGTKVSLSSRRVICLFSERLFVR